MKFNLDKESKTVLFIILGYIVLLSILAYFRFAIYDEKLFLHETAIMSRILANGEWIGRYGVGVHGFLFKLPVAIAFLVTGPSIYIATLFHVVLSGISAWIFYLIVKHFIKKKWLVISTLILLLTNFSYISWSTTFHREIPVLFATLLFVYIYTFSKSKYKYLLSGILLMLILDAKEYVFFMLLPPILVHIFVLAYSMKESLLNKTYHFVKKILYLLVPSFIFLLLMFYTNLIPINTFIASLLGFTESSFSYQIAHTLPDKALEDLSTYTNDNKVFNFVKNNIPNSAPKALRYATMPFGYFEKFFYISNFSFQGIPLILLIPSLSSSIFLFYKWRTKQKNLLFINFLYWSFLFIFLIRTSHERYLFPIIPFFVLFLVMYLILSKERIFKKYQTFTLSAMILATIFTFFYQNISNIKELFNIFASISFILLFLLLSFLKINKLLISKLIISALLISSIFITTYASSTKTQTYLSIKWGVNGETKQIAKLLEPNDTIYVDFNEGTVSSEFMYLINVYRANNYLPIEWHWRLDRNKIKRDLDKKNIKTNFYSAENINIDDIYLFRSFVYENQINKILLIKSDLPNERFPLENKIEILKKEDWVHLVTIKQMKNKKLFVFNVLRSLP